jgi:hypothetical protein
VEAVVGALAQDRRQRLVGVVVEDVPELVMDRAEVFRRLVDAHLDARVVHRVDVPRAGVTDDLAIARLGEQRPLPEGRRQRREAERGEEPLAVLHHVDRRDVARLEDAVEPDAAGAAAGRRRDQVEHVRPLLRPDVAEQVRRDRTVGRHLVAVAFPQLRTDVRVQRHVERPQLLPQPVHLAGEVVRRHVVLGPPHRAGIRVAEFPGALVRQLDEARVVGLQRHRDGVPAFPDLAEARRVAAARQFAGDSLDVEAAVLRRLARAVLAAAVDAFHCGGEPGDLGRLCRVGWCGQRQGALEHRDLPLFVRRRGRDVECGGAFREVCDRRHVGLIGARRDRFGIGRDVGGLHVGRLLGGVAQPQHRLVHVGHEGCRRRRRGRRLA